MLFGFAGIPNYKRGLAQTDHSDHADRMGGTLEK